MRFRLVNRVGGGGGRELTQMLMPDTTGNTYVDATLTNVVSFGDNVGILIFFFWFFIFMKLCFISRKYVFDVDVESCFHTT